MESLVTATLCPECLQVASLPHAAACSVKDEIEQVDPPQRERRKLECGHEEVAPEFFPLVSAAHEFKTPLVVMLGYAELLKAGQLGPINDRQKEVVGEIHESAQRLQKLIRDLLLLCELRAGKGGPEGMVGTTRTPLHEIFSYWAPVAKQKSLRYQFIAMEREARVAIDPAKLQHVISNLIENAIKYTPAGGQVIVKVKACFWERRKAQSEFLFNLERQKNCRIENAVRIDVTDTGPGIPQERQDDVFRDFVQLGKSSRGTGLGLAIARRLVETHRGAIWVESTLGKGSRFSVLLSQVR